MKLTLLFFVILLPIFSNAQAHLGSSESEIRKTHPDKTFTVSYADDGTKTISTFMIFGTFYYYISKETGLSYGCVQVIDDMPLLNGQIEAYNGKYVIISDSEWKAYLEGGGKMKITMTYDSEYEVYVFSYFDI